MTGAQSSGTTPFRVHVGDAASIWADADRRAEPAHLVVTPVRLHRRNVERRLREAALPRSRFAFARPAEVARTLLKAAGDAGDAADALDRVDRRALLQSVLDEGGTATERLELALGAPLTAQVDRVERARSEVEIVTNYRQSRLDALDSLRAGLDGTARADAADVVDGVLALEERLDERTSAAVSAVALLRDATALLRDSPDAWATAYPSIDRLSLAGVSTLSAPVADFLAAIADVTAVDVHLHLRDDTGPDIAARLGSRARVETDASGRPPDVPITELVAATREAEARVATGVVSALVDHGVPPADVTVVARDLDDYEEPLRRAARRRGLTPAFWTQLRLKRTRAYRLVASVCRALAADEPTADALVAPCLFGWVPPADSREDAGPIPQETLAAAVRELGPDTARPRGAWADVVAAADPPVAELEAYTSWLAARPDTPTRGDVRAALGPLLTGYREAVLPRQRAADDPTLSATETAARGYVRTTTLVDSVCAKYAEWTATGRLDPTWESVARLCDVLATQRPGRREHGNALAFDAREANDTWARTFPFVVAVGLVDGTWPKRTRSPLPAALRRAIRDHSATGDDALGVHAAWNDGRERDHFADTVRSASAHLILTRHRRDGSGNETRPAPFLAGVDRSRVDADAQSALLSAEPALPPSLAESVARRATDAGCRRRD